MLKSLGSFFENTPLSEARTFLIMDGGEDIADRFPFDAVLRHAQPVGISLSINSGLALVKARDSYYVRESRNGRPSLRSDFISYHQDDLLYSPGWLGRCLEAFNRYPDVCFVSGWKNDHSDHPTERVEGDFLLKRTLSGQHLMARKSYWYSIDSMTMLYGWNAGVVPYEPHRGGPEDPAVERGNPGPDRRCSRFDWYLMTDNARSPVVTGRHNIALDVMTNIGAEESTWQRG